VSKSSSATKSLKDGIFDEKLNCSQYYELPQGFLFGKGFEYEEFKEMELIEDR
jgi:hypothetical protein